MKLNAARLMIVLWANSNRECRRPVDRAARPNLAVVYVRSRWPSQTNKRHTHLPFVEPAQQPLDPLHADLLDVDDDPAATATTAAAPAAPSCLVVVGRARLSRCV